MFVNKTLMITGGTGSFGNSVLQYFLNTDIKEIRIFSRDEKKQEDMRINIKDTKVKFFLGDVRDLSSLENSMTGVDFVFHAAALKQVPSCEFYPMEAYKTNVIGTENIIKASINCQIKKLVILSTDKAVYPINAMGISKAMSEKLFIARSRNISKTGPVICGTRYGNVLASRGSVIPLFIDQIQNKKELTITDPKMTRFLMSLDESVKLVLKAFEIGQQGDIFVQKSPAAKLDDIANAILKILDGTNKIKIIGTRHGEKLYETLISREEMLKAIDLGSYYRIPADNRDLNYNKYFIEGIKLEKEIDDYTSHNTKQLNANELQKLLLFNKEIQELINA